tara:strand:+ start:168 stop:302 length:135 start_codon:yes stop_codon:yes gene_type:complete
MDYQKQRGGLHNADIQGAISATAQFDLEDNRVAGHGSGNTKNKY